MLTAERNPAPPCAPTDKTILLRIHPMPARCTPRRQARPAPKGAARSHPQPDECPLHMSNNAPRPKEPGSQDATPANSRPDAQIPSSNSTPHPHANGGARRDRTDDLMLAKHALSQLSYGPDAPQNGGPGKT